MKVEEKIGEITRLVVHNEEFSELYWNLSSFNALKVLQVQHKELEELHAVAWLLNPQGNHRLGDYFLKQFIKRVVISNEENEVTIPEGKLKLHLSNFYDAKIFSNWKAPRKTKVIDLLITSKANHLAILLIHKKVNENLNNHLQECLSLIKNDSEFANYTIIPIYLTETGEEAPLRNYCHFTLEDIYTLLEMTIDHHKGELNSKVEDFLIDYKVFLRDLYIHSDEQLKLSRSIYSDHKDIVHWLLREGKEAKNKELKNISEETLERYEDILRFIMEQGMEDPFVLAMDNFLQDKIDVSLSAKRLKDTEIWFYPIGFMDIEDLQKAVHPKWYSPYPVSYYFKKEPEKLKLKLEIGPFKEPNQRVAFIKFITDHTDYKINMNAFRLDSIVTTIKTEYIPFEEWEWGKEEIIVTRMNHLFKYKFAETHKELLQLMKKFDWKIR